MSSLKIPAGVKVEAITKKYFNKYFYKLVLNIEEKLIVNDDVVYSTTYTHPWSRRHQQRRALRRLSLDLIRTIKIFVDSDEKEDIRYRAEGGKVSVFTNNEEHISLILTCLPDNVTELYCPVNESHKEIIDKSRRIRVRPKLFNDKFKYRVLFEQIWSLREERYHEVCEWFQSLGDQGTRWEGNINLKRFMSTTIPYRHVGWTVAGYLATEEDVFLCQLKFHDIVHIIEEAVLIDDIKNNK